MYAESELPFDLVELTDSRPSDADACERGPVSLVEGRARFVVDRSPGSCTLSNIGDPMKIIELARPERLRLPLLPYDFDPPLPALPLFGPLAERRLALRPRPDPNPARNPILLLVVLADDLIEAELNRFERTPGKGTDGTISSAENDPRGGSSLARDPKISVRRGKVTAL